MSFQQFAIMKKADGMLCVPVLVWFVLVWFFKPDTPQCNRLSLGAVCRLDRPRMLSIKLNPH